MHFRSALVVPLVAIALFAAPVVSAREREPSGRAQIDAGRSLNLDFEKGDYSDWTAEGPAFGDRPVEGDSVAARRDDMKSQHAGRFWANSFDRGGDEPKGTLTSIAFPVSAPWCSFLVGGGAGPGTRVELIDADSGRVFYKVGGDYSEEMKRVAVQLKGRLGNSIIIRLVDDASNGWGHVNFDDFRLHEAKPAGPLRDAPPPDEYTHAGLTPEEAARAMTVPEGFKVTLFAGEPDIIQPIAMTIDERGRLWVVESHTYPIRQPEGQGKDRILIFEDADNDGRHDSKKVFAEGLNLVSGIEIGFGGVYVGAAPYLLFIPDKDRDDKPDGEPQVLLDGWGYEDTHETLNSFIWGPDGWLYGCHGVFTHSKVGKPGTPDADRVPINAGIWRYHPTKHTFEVFAEGTSNPWGVDFDANGQCLIEACVIPHLYHMVQGGRFERQAGQHFNPYTYDDIKTIADHRHYVGANPHAGNARSDSMGGGHAHAGLISYQGGAWPEEYNGALLMNNIHGARLNRDVLVPKGSGFIGQHRPDFLLSNDAWSQVVNLRTGPDGSLFMIDWYDANQCHLTDPTKHDRTNGRIFKVSYGEPTSLQVDLGKAATPELLRLLDDENHWYAQQVRRLLLEREVDPQDLFTLVSSAFGESFANGPRDEAGRPAKRPVKHRLRALWALHAAGDIGLHADKGLTDSDPYMRAWTIQLACEDGAPSAPIRERLVELAKSDPSPIVRLYLASALQRLPIDSSRWSILEGLLTHAEDVDDHNLPLMYWYALEPMAAAEPERALALARKANLPRLLEFTIRRVGALGTPESLDLLVESLGRSGGLEQAIAAARGINEALAGRREAKMPAEWPEISERLIGLNNPDLTSQVESLALTFGDPKALAALRVVLVDAKAQPERRIAALNALRKTRDPQLPGVLRQLLTDDRLRAPSLRALADFDDPETPKAVLGIYERLPLTERRDALNTLASRLTSAMALLDAVERKTIPSRDLSADVIRSLRNLKDPTLDARITEVWGQARESTADRAAAIAEWKAKLTQKPDNPPDLALGRAVFTKTCAQCHKLFDAGATIGPELTGSNRADLDYVLSNVLDSSALIGKDYQAQLVATADGRVLTGLIKSEDADAITLVTATETVVIPKAEIDERGLSDKSMMPDDLWATLREDEVRSLVAYLASPAQTPLLATADTAASLFNGQDLTGWTGDPALWSVEGGEIVGRSPGLAHNAFLHSQMVAGDFRLSLKIKLTPNSENSGIQFRSEPLPDGEMRGYQADAGQGWWGKLYEENGRALLWPESGEAHVKPDDWNDYVIEARGSKIQTWINGQPCVDLDDPSGARRGCFAFQLHAGGPLEVRLKDIKLEVDASTSE